MKPTIKRFEEVATKHGGNISRIADDFCVSRLTVYRWCEADERFHAAIIEHRGRLLDQCLETAAIVAIGIPIRDENDEVIGWQERPNPWMLKYLLSTLGRKDEIEVSSQGGSSKPTIPITIEVIDRREQIRTNEG